MTRTRPPCAKQLTKYFGCDVVYGAEVNLITFQLDQVRREVDGFRNLPQEAEKPVIVKASFYESIARLVITGPDNPEELRGLAHQFENELLARGIDKVDIAGLPEQEISIEIPSRTLNELQLSLDDVAAKVDGFSQDVPAGIIGDAIAAKELRSLDQRRTESEFATIPLVSDESRLIRLGDVADIEAGRAMNTISRRDTQRLGMVTAEVDENVTTPLEVTRLIEEQFADLPDRLPRRPSGGAPGIGAIIHATVVLPLVPVMPIRPSGKRR